MTARTAILAATAPTVTDWISAVATGVTAIVAIAAAVFAFFQVREARNARTQVADLERERSQPYVAVFFEQHHDSPMMFDLVIKNFGATAARDVRVSLDPWPRRSADRRGEDRVGVPDLPYLAPGQEWRTWWDVGTTRVPSNLPKRHDGRVRYSGIGSAQLQEDICLDLSVLDEQSFSTRKTVDHVAKATEKLAKAVESFKEDLHGGLAVYVRSGAERDRRREEQWREMRHIEDRDQGVGSGSPD